MDRRFPIVPFEAERFRAFFGPKVDCLNPKLFSGGACNSNYLVTSGGSRLVCRIYSRGDPARERSIIKRVEGIVPVPDYLWVGDGVAVMSFIGGTHFSPTAALMRDAGRIIGRLSKISFDQSGEILADGEVEPFPGWASLHAGLSSLLQEAKVAEFLAFDLIEKTGKAIDRNKDLLDMFDEARNLVHGDFRPDNLLVSEDAIVGVLDWEFAHSGSSFMDIGNLLRHFPSHWNLDLAEGLREEEFDLPDDSRYRSLLIDLASHLEFLTSQRSADSKGECARRIEEFANIHDCHGRRGCAGDCRF